MKNIIVTVASILSLVCLVFFIMYMGKYLSDKKDSDTQASAEAKAKTSEGVKNGIMTTLIGIAICQATIVVATICMH